MNDTPDRFYRETDFPSTPATAEPESLPQTLMDTEGNPHIVFRRPELAKAIAAVMKEVVRLEKDQDNTFAKYKFTSVDDYKDMLRPLMAANGIVPCMSQLRCNSFFNEDSKGKKSMQCQFDFELWLEHTSGEVSEREGSTVWLPYTGAQTSGQARSYAMKEWLKSKFLASSGDIGEDADSHGLDIKMSKAQARDLYDSLTAELKDIGNAGDKAAHDAWYAKNSVLVDAMPNDWTVHLRNEWQQAKLQIEFIERGVDVSSQLPDVTKWKSDFEAELRAATNEADMDDIWTGHEDTIENLIPTDRAEVERIYRECLEKVQ